MRAALIALVLALAGCQPQEPTLRGTVVSVVEAVQPEPHDDSGRQYEPPLVPEVAWKIRVQLDDGADVIVKHQGAKRYEPGERVRLVVAADGALLL